MHPTRRPSSPTHFAASGGRSLRPGAVLDGRFVLERALGTGATGVAWLACDQSANDASVVVKVLHPTFDRYSMAIRQLEREAEILAQFTHPNIPRPILFSTNGAHTYIAMQFVEGVPLDREMGRRWKSGAHFNIEWIRRIFEQMCAAVSHAHSKGIVHRDLKPQNIIITNGPDGLAVKVLDFGTAKILETNVFEATTAGRCIGSIFYMAPEQCNGATADYRTDVFALGTILFELLTLRRAWARDEEGRHLPAFEAPIAADPRNSLGAVLYRIMTAERPRPSDHRPEIPPALDRVVKRATAVDPADRYPTVRDLIADFSRAIGRTPSGLDADDLTVRDRAPVVKAVLPDGEDTRDVDREDSGEDSGEDIREDSGEDCLEIPATDPAQSVMPSKLASGMTVTEATRLLPDEHLPPKAATLDVRISADVASGALAEVVRPLVAPPLVFTTLKEPLAETLPVARDCRETVAGSLVTDRAPPVRAAGVRLGPRLIQPLPFFTSFATTCKGQRSALTEEVARPSGEGATIALRRSPSQTRRERLLRSAPTSIGPTARSRAWFRAAIVIFLCASIIFLAFGVGVALARGIG